MSNQNNKYVVSVEILIHSEFHAASGPKISIFLTLPIVTRAAYSTPSRSSRGKHGKCGKIFHFYNGMETLLLHFINTITT